MQKIIQNLFKLMIVPVVMVLLNLLLRLFFSPNTFSKIWGVLFYLGWIIFIYFFIALFFAPKLISHSANEILEKGMESNRKYFYIALVILAIGAIFIIWKTLFSGI